MFFMHTHVMRASPAVVIRDGASDRYLPHIVPMLRSRVARAQKPTTTMSQIKNHSIKYTLGLRGAHTQTQKMGLKPSKTPIGGY